MSVFCLLFAPLFLLFRLSLVERERRDISGVFWAFLLGIFSALAHYFAESYVRPQGFGISRLLCAFVDIVFVPSVLPFFVALVPGIFRNGTGNNRTPDFRSFAFVWLIPENISRLPAWSTARDPLYLILVPLLWTAVAEGISFFLEISRREKFPAKIMPLFAAAVPPAAAALAFWFFFCQQMIPGAAALGAALVPAIISTVLAVIPARGVRKPETLAKLKQQADWETDFRQ